MKKKLSIPILKDLLFLTCLTMISTRPSRYFSSHRLDLNLHIHLHKHDNQSSFWNLPFLFCICSSFYDRVGYIYFCSPNICLSTQSTACSSKFGKPEIPLRNQSKLNCFRVGPAYSEDASPWHP